MRIVINNIKMPIRHKNDEVISAAREIVRSNFISAKDYRIYKQSIDARRKNNIHYVYSVVAETSNKIRPNRDIQPLDAAAEFEIPHRSLSSRPVVAGMGPCGLFAAYALALSGNPPLILERGEDVDSRAASVEDFWNGGKLKPNSNVQFGEGGAGTFSDGKLTTRIGDYRQGFVLRTLAECGAPEDILYKAKPHVGTDMLRGVIKNMRKKLIDMGSEVRFNTCVTDLKLNGGKLCEVVLNGTESIPCDTLVLAIGHSSRDTYYMLSERGIELVPKPFAVGVRIEHTQSFIDRLQYGTADELPPADYRVAYNEKERSCYSFCMCPGGTVVNASSEAGLLAVNGMSNHKRDGVNANSALVVTVKPSDFGSGVLGGAAFQRRYEKLAFELGGGKAPVQLAEDFINDRCSTQFGAVVPSIVSGVKLAELKECLPDFVSETLKHGLLDFEHRMNGFASRGAVLTGIESRTSAPVRIMRGDDLQSVSVKGVYPAGEGAGYAGGIVSAAVDGLRAAIAIITSRTP